VARSVPRRGPVEELVQKAQEAASGRPRVVDASGWPAADWDALAARSPLGDALQSYEWGEVKRSLGWTPLRYAVEVGGRRVAVVSIQERPLIRRAPGPFAITRRVAQSCWRRRPTPPGRPWRL